MRKKKMDLDTKMEYSNGVLRIILHIVTLLFVFMIGRFVGLILMCIL